MIRFIWILTIICLSAITELKGQTSAGHIDYDLIKNSIPEFQIGMIHLSKQENQLEMQIQKEIEGMVNGLGGCGQRMPTDSLARANFIDKREKELQALTRRIETLQHNAITRLRYYENEFLGRIHEKIMHKLELFQIEKGITALVDKNALLYGPNSHDFTQEFIAYYLSE